jgi:perosamine synthetase
MLTQNEVLAHEGGTPVISTHQIPKPRKRWGGSELESLRSMLEEPTLFYWKHASVKALVENFRMHYPLEYVMPCSSGTAAIHIALCAAGIAPGDEVITSPVTDMGTVIGILYQQGVPVFADLGRRTYNLNPRDVEARITPKTKAIIAVHLTGNPCDMEALGHIAKKHGLILIEDCAQAWGTRWRGRPVGTIGDIGCYSLNDFKHVGCGDGGIVATNNTRYGPLLQRFGDKGYDRTTGSHSTEALAPCYRMSAPQAAVAAVQLNRLEAISKTRNHLGNLLCSLLDGIPGILPQKIHQEDFSSYWFTMMRVELNRFRVGRNDFAAALRAEGLQAGAGYIPTPVYQYKVFTEANFFGGRWPLRESGLTTMDYNKVSCPEAEAILKTAVRLEVKEWMTEEYMHLAAAAIRKVAAHYLIP